MHAEGARHMTFHFLRMGSHKTLKYEVKGTPSTVHRGELTLTLKHTAMNKITE